MNKTASILAALVITGAALAYALKGTDPQELISLLSSGRYWALTPFLGMLCVFFWLKALRWALILRPLGKFTWAEVAPAMMIGYAANNLLPARIGELIRIVVFARKFDQSVSGVFVSLVLERFLDFSAILVLYCGAILAMDAAPNAFASGAWIAFGIIVAMGLGILALLFPPNFMIGLWGKVSGWLSEGRAARIKTILQNGILALSSLKSPTMMGLLLAYSLLHWCVMAMMVWVALWTFGAIVPLAVIMIVLAVVSLAVTVPSAPGFVGAIQAAFVFALAPFDVTQETALAASVFFLIAQWVPVTLVGVICFVFADLRISQVRQGVEDVKHG